MITLMTIIYVGAILLVFKVLKVPPRPWPIAAFVVFGVLMIGTIVVLWTLACPMTSRVVVSRYVIQIVTYEKGRVVSVPAAPNVPLKKGETLFQVDPAPFQDTVDQLTANLATAKNNVLKLQAALESATSGVTAAQANVVSTKTVYDDRLALQKEDVGAVATQKVVEAEANYKEAKASLREAQANVVQSTSALDVAKSNVVSVNSQLKDAQFNLQVCTVQAPSDGIVTDWQIRPGTFVVPIAIAAVGTFIDTTDTFIVASFPGEELIYIKPGQSVEMAFNTRPGQLFQGKVENILQATGEGQYAPSGKLPSAAAVGSKGFLAVKISLDDPEAGRELALGAAGTVAIYSDFGKPIHFMSKVGIRMKKWLYFLPPLPTKT
jgi:multidrug resistance efflux pump